jgi:signal transduction histidine kinase
VGIGLSLVKHIVEAHGGQVRVESQLGEGSRFVIELPVNEPPPKTAP